MNDDSATVLPAQRQPRPTMKDVAALAGVGIKTVSRVINQEPRVSPEMSTRVWDAVHALDYQVDWRAGSLRRADGRTRTIGLLVSSVNNPFAGEMHKGIEDIAQQRNVAVLSSSSEENPEREARAIDDFIQRHVDGIILDTTSHDHSQLQRSIDRGLPIVFVDRMPQDIQADCVTSDNRAAMTKATLFLLQAGHRRLALLTEAADTATAAHRREGFLDAIDQSDIPPEDTIIIEGLSSSEDAERALYELLTDNASPSAIISAQNLITIGALHALKRAGKQHSVALIGFDDLPLSDLLDPALTVIRQNPRLIGQRAAELLFQRLDGQTIPPQHVVIPTELIHRGSGEIPPPDALS